MIPGRTIELSGRTIQAPPKCISAKFVRFLRAHWPEPADRILEHLKCMYAERQKHGSEYVLWQDTAGREFTLPEKLRFMNDHGLVTGVRGASVERAGGLLAQLLAQVAHEGPEGIL